MRAKTVRGLQKQIVEALATGQDLPSRVKRLEEFRAKLATEAEFKKIIAKGQELLWQNYLKKIADGAQTISQEILPAEVAEALRDKADGGLVK